MKKMKGKKKWFAALLTLCLLISLIPMSVFADGVTDDIVPGSNYKHTYHTKISATANVTIKDADGNVVETATVKKSSDDFMEGNLSDKNVQNEITRICDEIETQYSSRGTVTIEKRNGQMVFDHFESSNVINSENNTVNKDLDIHEYQVYELSYDITVQEPQADDTVITTVDVGNVWKTLEADKEVVYTGEVNPNSECANQMELVMEGWQENAIDGWTLRSTRKDDKPKAGSEYYYFVELKAKDGYVFPKDMHTLSNVICDGKTYTSWGGSSSDDGKSATIYFYDIAVTATDNTVTDNAIKNVEISEATTTYAVGNCPYDYAYPSGENASKYKLVYTHWEEMEERDGELVPVRHWYSDTKENENLPENQKFDEFKSNTKYMYSIKLEAINGNTFATTDEGLSVTVNCKDGSSIKPKNMYVSNDGTSVYIDTITTITPREWQEIKEIEIIGATTSFKVGDKPVFTGKVPENAPYIYQCERWENGTSGITSADFWNTTDSWDEVITSFEKGRTFYYGLYFKADIGYYFSRNTKLKVNGQYVNYTVDYFMHDDPDRMDTYWIKTDLAMTPTETTVTDDTNKDTTGGTANPTTTVTDNKNTGTVTTAPATTAQTKTKTTAKTSPKAATTPKTGDNNLMIMWFAIMSASAACLAAHSVRRRHRAGR